MPPVYDSHNVSVTVNAAGPRTKLFTANSNRVSLIIAAGGTIALNELVFISTKPQSSGDFLWFAPGTTEKVTYRDYGPLVQEEIWCQVNSGSATITATEIVRIPRMV